MLRTARSHSFQSIGSITIRIEALGQQLMVDAQVFEKNFSGFDVILGWLEFKSLLHQASQSNPA